MEHNKQKRMDDRPNPKQTIPNKEEPQSYCPPPPSMMLDDNIYPSKSYGRVFENGFGNWKTVKNYTEVFLWNIHP
jgi:hypothetical protein